jgi:hypothetical protein
MSTVIQGLDPIDIMETISQKQRKFLAITLQAVEEIMADDPNYKFVRQAVLSNFNNYTRSISRSIFGDIEIEN